jgi:opacity protein-like surface antigen
MGKMAMTRFPAKTFLMAAALGVLVTSVATSAVAEATAPAGWELKPDTGYAYDKEGRTFSYKMGTSNAGLLLKGAKKVPKGTLFFIGQNGQLYIRTGPYLEGDGKFMFGSN